VPGCHASAFLLPVVALIRAGIVSPAATLTCFSLTGYSGGGKKMIASYEDPAADRKLHAPRHYALGMTHKHLPEMQKIAGLAHAPLFTPVVCDVHSGLAVELFLPAEALARQVTLTEIRECLAAQYAEERFVRVLTAEQSLEDDFFDITACNGTNRADIGVFGHEGQTAVITRLDNLGKGAAGAAIQCLNLLLGTEEGSGLTA
jgi:N-acetyl-gamma-glutamyl-phosphate reductase